MKKRGGKLRVRPTLLFRHRSLVARTLLIALLPLALDGCVSIGVSRADLSAPPEPSAPPRGAITVDVFEKMADREAQRRVAYPILSEIYRDGGDQGLVARSMHATFTVPDLPPGTYRLRIAKKIDENGNVVSLSDPANKTFDVAAGERTVVSVVLKKVPVVWIVLAALTVIALVVLVIIGIDRGKIHPPPLPPLPLPPVAIVIPVGGGGETGASALPPPVAVDVFPAPGSVVAARRVTVSFLLNVPLGGAGIEDGAVAAIGSMSGEIAGTAAFDPDEQLLTFAPSRDFAPGETVTVTLDLSKLQGEAGTRGSGLTSTSFEVAK